MLLPEEPYGKTNTQPRSCRIAVYDMTALAPFAVDTDVLVPYARSGFAPRLLLDGKLVHVIWKDATVPLFKVLRYSSFRTGPWAHLVFTDSKGYRYRMYLAGIDTSMNEQFHITGVLEGYWRVTTHPRHDVRCSGRYFGVRYIGSSPLR